MKRHILSGACFVCALLGGSNIYAGDSPLSPAFVLQENQLLSTSRVGYKKINFASYYNLSGFGVIDFSREARGVFASQTLEYGLGNGTELTVSESYDDFNLIGSQAVQIADGFSSPTLGARHTWGMNNKVRLTIWGDFTPKTADHGLRGTPAIYDVGTYGTFITDNGLVTQLMATRTMIDGSGLYLTSLGIAAYKEMGLYSLGANLAIIVYDGAKALQPDNANSIGLTFGRKLCENMWAQIRYSYTDTSYKEQSLSESIRVGASVELSEVSASLNVLF
jgi:hypothetical protein